MEIEFCGNVLNERKKNISLIHFSFEEMVCSGS